MAYLLLALAAIFWGGNYVVGHTLVEYVDPYALSLIRWGGTTLLMVALYWKSFTSDFNVMKKDLKLNFFYALLGQVMFPLSLYIGLQYTTSLNAAIYISITPCIVLLINFFIFKESISLKNIVGVLSSTLGVLYLAFSNAKGTRGLAHFGIGDILTIISALSWAFYCALLRLKNRKVSNTSFVAFSSLLGTLILIPIYLVNSVAEHKFPFLLKAFSFIPLLGIAYLIIFPSWLAYVFWSKGVSLIGTTRSEIFTHVIPLSGGLMGILFLGNTFQSYHLITLILIIFGIVCCSSHGRTRQKTLSSDTR